MLALAASRGYLASGSYDTTVRFWSLENLRCAHKARGGSPSPVFVLIPFRTDLFRTFLLTMLAAWAAEC